MRYPVRRVPEDSRGPRRHRPRSGFLPTEVGSKHNRFRPVFHLNKPGISIPGGACEDDRRIPIFVRVDAGPGFFACVQPDSRGSESAALRTICSLRGPWKNPSLREGENGRHRAPLTTEAPRTQRKHGMAETWAAHLRWQARHTATPLFLTCWHGGNPCTGPSERGVVQEVRARCVSSANCCVIPLTLWFFWDTFSPYH